MFLKGSKLFLVILQAVLIFHPKLSATNPLAEKHPEIVDQPIARGKFLHQNNLNVQQDAVERVGDALQGIADKQEDKATGSYEWRKEEPAIPMNITDLCSYEYRQQRSPEVYISSINGFPNIRFYPDWSNKYEWSPADPLPWMSIDFKQTRKIYYFDLRIGDNYYSDTKVFKMFYGDEKKEGWNITGEKLFNIYPGKGSNWLAKPYNSHYAEGRYFYIIKYPEDAQMVIGNFKCIGV